MDSSETSRYPFQFYSDTVSTYKSIKCRFLGMTTRTTDDIDLLVRQGTIAAVKKILAQSCLRFVLDKRTRHLKFHSSIDSSERPLNIDVLSPQMAYIPYELVRPIQASSMGTREYLQGKWPRGLEVIEKFAL